MTYRPCRCEVPGERKLEPLGTLGTIVRGQAYRDPRRKALGLPDVTKDGGGALKGGYWSD